MGKSFMSAPNITPKQRSNYFTKAKAPEKIAASQTLFDKLLRQRDLGKLGFGD